MKRLERVKKNQKKDPNPSQSHQCRSDGIKPRQLSSFPNQSFWMLHLPNFKGHTKPTAMARARVSARWPRGEHGAEQGIARVSQQGDDGSHKTVDVPGRSQGWDRWQTASAKIRHMPPSLPKLGQKSKVSNSVGSKFDHPILVESQKKRKS